MVKNCKSCIHYDVCIFHLTDNEANMCARFYDRDNITKLKAEADALKKEVEALHKSAVERNGWDNI